MTVRDTRDAYPASAFDAVMKRFYDGTVGRLFPTWVPALEWIQRKGNKIKPKGEKIYFAVETKLGAGVGPRGENGAFPAVDEVTNLQGSVDYDKGFKGRIALSAEAMKFMKEGAGSFTDALKQESRGLVDAMKLEAHPACWGVGNGILASSSAVMSTDPTLTLVSTETSAACYPGTRWLREGMRLGCHTSASDYTADGEWTVTSATNKISSITSNLVVEMNGDNQTEDTATDTRYYTSYGSVTDGTAGSYTGPQGLLAMCDDGSLAPASYCGISETDNPQWKGVVSANGGNTIPLTLRRIYRLYNRLARKKGSLDLDVAAWTNPDLFEEVVELLEHHVEFKPQQLKGGFKNVEIAIHEGAPIKFKLDFAAPGYIMFFDPSKITFAEACPLEVASEDGSKFHRLADYDQYELRWRWIWNLYTTKRNAHGMLADISYTVSSI